MLSCTTWSTQSFIVCAFSLMTIRSYCMKGNCWWDSRITHLLSPMQKTVCLSVSLPLRTHASGTMIRINKNRLECYSKASPFSVEREGNLKLISLSWIKSHLVGSLTALLYPRLVVDENSLPPTFPITNIRLRILSRRRPYEWHKVTFLFLIFSTATGIRDKMCHRTDIAGGQRN